MKFYFQLLPELNKIAAYVDAVFFVISPVTIGRLLLFILSISISKISLKIILNAIISVVINVDAINCGDLTKYINDGFIIYPPLKDKNIVGAILFALINFKNDFVLGFIFNIKL